MSGTNFNNFSDKQHNVILEDRKKLALSGVTEVESFEEDWSCFGRDRQVDLPSAWLLYGNSRGTGSVVFGISEYGTAS